MSEVSITTHQLEMMRHATGDKRDGHRNYFAAGEDDVPAWRDLVAKGLASEPRRVEWVPYAFFSVTERGLDVAYGVSE